MAAPIGIERAEQPVFVDRLGEPEKARQGALLLHQDRRIDRACGIVERDHQVEILLQPRDPAMCRTVLEQQHARQRSARTPLTMCAAPLRLRHQAGRLERQAGHRVAELVAVSTHQLLVKVLHREVAVAITVELPHAIQLAHRSPSRRHLADPPIAKTLDPFIRKANTQSTELPARHPQQLACLLRRQARPPVWRNASSKRLTKTSHSARVRRIDPSRTGGELGGQLTRYKRRTNDPLRTLFVNLRVQHPPRHNDRSMKSDSPLFNRIRVEPESTRARTAPPRFASGGVQPGGNASGAEGALARA